jgi:hypothetical protein
MTGFSKIELRKESCELRLRGFAANPSESLCHFVTSPFEKGRLPNSGWRRINFARGKPVS